MSFAAQNPLEEALVRAVADKATVADFYSLLLDSDLLVIGTVNVSEQDAASGKFTAGPGSRFQLESGERDGAKFLPVFSSLPRMQSWAKRECKYIAMNARALFEMTRGAPVVLNPASDYGRAFSADQIAFLLNPQAPLAPVQDSYPEVPLPPTLANALCDVFDKRGDVAMAWMIQIRPESGPVPVPVVGVETSADMAALMADIEKMARVHVPGLVFDVQRIDRDNPLAFSQVMLKATPFYPRATARPN